MSNALISQLKWQIYRLIERLDTLTKIALGVLCALLLIYVVVHQPQQSTLAGLMQNTVDQAAIEAGQVQGGQVQAAPSPATDLAAYVAQFPKLATRAGKINALIDLAKQQNLLLDEITYKTETKLNQPLSPYQVEFSLFAPYAEVHQFLSAVLTQMPYVALGGLTLRRENVQDDVVEARIQLIFYFDVQS